MKVIVLFFYLIFLCLPVTELHSRELGYLGESQSLIEWEKLDKSWMDFQKWKQQLRYKEENTEWKILIKNRKHRESLGRAVHCVGNCQIFKGLKVNSLKFRSQLKEGDEVTTAKNSYAWVFLLDGTLIRLSPETSISFKEINVGIESIFFHVRINQGNILWLARDIRPIVKDNNPESDTLFLPLKKTLSGPGHPQNL
jgi:hypothetical protein